MLRTAGDVLRRSRLRAVSGGTAIATVILGPSRGPSIWAPELTADLLVCRYDVGGPPRPRVANARPYRGAEELPASSPPSAGPSVRSREGEGSAQVGTAYCVSVAVLPAHSSAARELLALCAASCPVSARVPSCFRRCQVGHSRVSLVKAAMPQRQRSEQKSARPSPIARHLPVPTTCQC